MLSLNDLKKNSDNLLEKYKSDMDKKKYDKDTRFWIPSVDKAGNGFAIIRFLDSPQVDLAKNPDALPFVTMFKHGFKGPSGQWYIENSLSTIGQNDPVAETNSILWNTKDPMHQNTARDRKRKLSYISNIYVIADPANPENEGKVFLYSYGQKIYDKIKSLSKPPHSSIPSVRVFDFWKGANFRLQIKNVKTMINGREVEYRNYDDSIFESVSAVGDDSLIERLWRESYSLAEFHDLKNFKSYAELKARLEVVLGKEYVHSLLGGSTSVSAAPAIPASAPARASKTANDYDDDLPFEPSKPVSAPASVTAKANDDDLDYFARLAAED